MNKLKIAIIFLTSFFIKNTVCSDIVFLNLTNNVVKTRLIYSLQDKDARSEDRVVNSFDALAVPIDTVARDLEVSFCEKFIFDAQKVAKGKQYEYFGGIFNKIDLKDIISKNKDILVVINHVDGVFSPSKMIVFNDANSFDQYIFSDKGVFRGLMTIAADDNNIAKIVADIKKIIGIKNNFEKIEESIKEKSKKSLRLIEKKEKKRKDIEDAKEKELRDEEDAKWSKISYFNRAQILARRGTQEFKKSISTLKSYIEKTDDLGKLLFYAENYGKKTKNYLLELKMKLGRLLDELGEYLEDTSNLCDLEIFEKEGKEFNVTTIMMPISNEVAPKPVDEVKPFKVKFGINKEVLKEKLFNEGFSMKMRSYYDRIDNSVKKMGLTSVKNILPESQESVIKLNADSVSKTSENVKSSDSKKEIPSTKITKFFERKKGEKSNGKKKVITMDDDQEETFGKKNVITMDDYSVDLEEEGEVSTDKEDSSEEEGEFTEQKDLSTEQIKSVSKEGLDAPDIKDFEEYDKTKKSVKKSEEVSTSVENKQSKTVPQFKGGMFEELKIKAEAFQNKKVDVDKEVKKNIKEKSQQKNPSPIGIEKENVKVIEAEAKLNTSNLWNYDEEEVRESSDKRIENEKRAEEFRKREQIKRLESTVKTLEEKESLSYEETNELKRAKEELERLKKK